MIGTKLEKLILKGHVVFYILINGVQTLLSAQLLSSNRCKSKVWTVKSWTDSSVLCRCTCELWADNGMIDLQEHLSQSLHRGYFWRDVVVQIPVFTLNTNRIHNGSELHHESSLVFIFDLTSQHPKQSFKNVSKNTQSGSEAADEIKGTFLKPRLLYKNHSFACYNTNCRSLRIKCMS